ncbi:MAG: hypothetical protein ACI8R4_001781 [Paracoccaceae bacterium]|jgi:hypothetical protein
MSEPVSNVEIEDVLSSIRRLVSEEHRSELRPAPKETPVQSSRLVLTPALRVADFPQPVPEAEPEPVAKQAAQFDTPPESESVPETDIWAAPEAAEEVVEEASAELEWQAPEEAAQSEDQSEDQPEVAVEANAGSDAELAPEPEVTPWLLTEPEISESQEATDASAAPDDAPWRDPDATLFEAAQSLKDAQSAEDAVLHDEGIETDTDQLSNMGLAKHDDLPAEDDEDIWLADTAAAFDPIADTDEDAADPWHRPVDAPVDVEFDRTAALSAKIAALEATIGQTQDQWEPDGEIGDDYAGTKVETIEWQDHDIDEDSTVEPLRPTPLHPEPVAEVPFQAKPDDDSRDTLVADEAILDEESLRELVADIVRQELQGALGERITRNVRKLVRREIHRALTSQELD